MGRISRFDLSHMIRTYDTPMFFETGTFRGEGVQYALHSPFKKVISVEIVPQIADEARKKFSSADRVKIIEDESASALEKELPLLKGNCIFWLDAHFPGADAGMTQYDADLDESVRLPLEKELEIISRLRKGYRDILIIDDLRIYEDGPYQNGNVPADALPKGGVRSIDFVYKYFRSTHTVHRLYQEEGYIVLLPKKNYWFFKNLLNKWVKPNGCVIE